MIEAARLAELLPFGEELAVLVEDLQPVVLAVGDEEPALRVERQRVGRRELARPGALPAPRLDELAVGGKLDDARVCRARRRRRSTRPCAVTAKHGLLNSSGPSPATPFLPSVISTLPVGLNFHTWLPLPSFMSASVTQISPLASTQKPVRKDEEPGAEALHQFARGVELVDRRHRRVRAVAVAAALEHPDVLAVLGRIDADHLAEMAAVRQLRPARHLVIRHRIGVGIGRLRPDQRRERGECERGQKRAGPQSRHGGLPLVVAGIIVSSDEPPHCRFARGAVLEIERRRHGVARQRHEPRARQIGSARDRRAAPARPRRRSAAAIP